MTSPYPPGLARARRGLQSHQERGVVVVALGFGRRRRSRGVELGGRHDVVEQRRVLADGADRRELRDFPEVSESSGTPRAALGQSRARWPGSPQLKHLERIPIPGIPPLLTLSTALHT